jgi:hypothetical protein
VRVMEDEQVLEHAIGADVVSIDSIERHGNEVGDVMQFDSLRRGGGGVIIRRASINWSGCYFRLFN